MPPIALSERKPLHYFKKLAESLPKFSIHGLRLQPKTNRKQGTNVLLVVEDSPTEVAVIKHELNARIPGYDVQVVKDWMSAVVKITEADCVVIDWVLADGITVVEAGALALLQKMNIPHFIFTNSPELVPADVGCKVISKADRSAGLDEIERALSLA